MDVERKQRTYRLEGIANNFFPHSKFCHPLTTFPPGLVDDEIVEGIMLQL